MDVSKDFWIWIFKEFDQGTFSTMPGFFGSGFLSFFWIWIRVFQLDLDTVFFNWIRIV